MLLVVVSLDMGFGATFFVGLVMVGKRVAALLEGRAATGETALVQHFPCAFFALFPCKPVGFNL